MDNGNFADHTDSCGLLSADRGSAVQGFQASNETAYKVIEKDGVFVRLLRYHLSGRYCYLLLPVSVSYLLRSLSRWLST